MSDDFELNGLATAIGTMPHTDPRKACSSVLNRLPEIPAWPQLPRRSFRENMYAQCAEGLPGLVVEGESLWVDRSTDLSKPLERLYAAYLNNDLSIGALGRDYAQGFYEFLEQAGRHEMRAVKGQVTGPISFGLSVTDQDRRPLLYDETLADALAKHLMLKAAWQESKLKAVCPTTIISVDEPYLSSLGSAYVSLSRERAVSLLEETLRGISGLKAVHCCGNTDWSLLLGTSIDILCFDAYGYAETLALYAGDVRKFLQRGGVVAWGIVPNDERSLARETEDGLLARLFGAMDRLAGKGVDHDMIVSRCLITPSCGLASMPTEAAAERALEMTARVSAGFRRKYKGEN